MRLLADQNIPRAVVNTLRDEGYDVKWAQETHPGANDDVLLTLAVEESRIVLTFDKDFGELAFRTRLPASCGIILLRITPVTPSAVANIIVRTLRMRNNWSGQFSVVEDTRIRMRPLPS